MEKHLIAYYIGIFIIFGSHVYCLFKSKDKEMINHSWLNIFGALLIAYYFMNKENMWKYLTMENERKEYKEHREHKRREREREREQINNTC